MDYNLELNGRDMLGNKELTIDQDLLRRTHDMADDADEGPLTSDTVKFRLDFLCAGLM